MTTEIKSLEKEFHIKSGGSMKIRVPVSPRHENYGCPLFRFEFVYEKGEEGYCFRTIYIGIPHFDEEGHTAWREIECNTTGIALADVLHDNNIGRWFFMTICPEHGMPGIAIYPPCGAKYLILDNLYSGVSSYLIWELENES